jgi:hypothetical protein
MHPQETSQKHRKNRLRRIIVVQDIVRRETAGGRTMSWVHRHIIYPQFFISYGTLSRWMGVPALKQLNKIEQWESQKADASDTQP